METRTSRSFLGGILYGQYYLIDSPISWGDGVGVVGGAHLGRFWSVTLQEPLLVMSCE